MRTSRANSPIPPVEVEVKVPFHDVDAMRIVWHGHYLKYFEIARTALMESVDYAYEQMKESGFAWPIIDIQSRHAGPATVGDVLRITATLVEWEHRLRIRYQVINTTNGKRITRGTSTQVAVAMPDFEMCYRSPPILFEKLGLPVPQ